MPLETGSYISDLVSTNPVSTDGLGQADDHLRLIKDVLKTSFPNVNAAVSISMADLLHGFTPIGGIILWSGAISAIPTNWHLCNGASGTPDLRDKFVIAADADSAGTYNVGASGGSLTTAGLTTNTDGAALTDSQGAHTHTGTSGNTTLTAGQIPAHTHNTTVTSTGTNIGFNGGGSTFLDLSAGTGITLGTYTSDSGSVGGGSHNHTIGSDGAHTHTASNHAHGLSVTVNPPPYYALAYIQRIS